jgi:hypothetical protein
MAGKYHRTYLDSQLQPAFEAMQLETKVASNAYIAKAVRVQLEKDGYLAPKRNLAQELREAMAAKVVEKEEVPRRRRRPRRTIQ